MNEIESKYLLFLFGGIFFAILMTLFVVGIILVHRQRQLRNKQKLDQVKAEYEKTLLDTEFEIQQETLTQVGRELHDNIGQLLSLAKLNLNSSKPEKQAEGKEYINQIIQEVRSLSKTLNLDWVESITLEEFIAQQLKKIETTGFCETIFEPGISLPNLKKDQKLILIRVIQECLNNIIKHASPEQIQICITEESSLKKIRIKDNGIGFDTTLTSTGSGLINLKKRMETIGGKFALSSTIGNGTEIELHLPN
jgi:two-component system, NarL family, sensor kinase